MTPNALRRRADLVMALAGILGGLPDDEKQAAVLVLAWLARTIADAKLDEPDPQYAAAVRLVARTERCSIVWLQRKLGLAYDRAASIVAEMEARGLVGSAESANDREVLVRLRDGRRVSGAR